MKKILIIAIALIVIYKVAEKSDDESHFDASDFNKNEVVLYATDWCGYCRKTRKFFAENNI